MPKPTLDEIVARLKAVIPQLIDKANAAGSTDPDDDANVVDLQTLADQAEAALGAPAPAPAPAANGGTVDPGSPAVAAPGP